MFDKILFPIDGSEYSKRTLDYVGKMAKNFNAKILLLHSNNIPLIDYSPYFVPNKEMDEIQLESCKEILKEAKLKLEEIGLHPETLLKEGNAGQMIVQTAEEHNCDLIVMGFRGLGTVGSLLLGSVSNYVIHHTKLPVMLLH